MDYEKSLITQCVASNRVKEAVDMRITEELFTFQGGNRPVWKFIMEFFLIHRTSPSPKILMDTFKDFKPVKDTVEFAWLVTQMHETFRINKINSCMRSVSKSQSNRDSEKSVEYMRKCILEVDNASVDGRDTDWVETAEERKELYNAVEACKGMLGIPTYWPVLNDITGGVVAGEFWVIVARTHTGKSWLEVILAWHAAMSGYKVMLVSPEMKVAACFRRLDAIHTGLSFDSIRRGKLSVEEKGIYFLKLEELSRMQNRLWVVGDGEKMSPAKIASKQEKYHPDITFVDGMYLLDDDLRGRDKVTKLANISNQLQKVAMQSNIPLISSAQLNRDSTKKTKGDDLRNISWGDQIAQDADVALRLYQDEDMRERDEPTIEVKQIKFREGAGRRWDAVLNWDFDKMRFDEIPQDTSDNRVVDMSDQMSLLAEVEVLDY